MWSEVFTITAWLLCIVLLLGIAGGTKLSAMGLISSIGIVLFVLGSWMNTWAEYTRHTWKQRSENRGKLYTEGLFRYTRHPNYLGDLLSFSGLSLISGAWATGIMPLIMLAGFVFVNIPMLDAHLQDRYCRAFEEYGRHSKKLIPFMY